MSDMRFISYRFNPLYYNCLRVYQNPASRDWHCQRRIRRPLGWARSRANYRVMQRRRPSFRQTDGRGSGRSSSLSQEKSPADGEAGLGVEGHLDRDRSKVRETPASCALNAERRHSFRPTSKFHATEVPSP